MMRDYHREQTGLNRREFLIGLSAVSLMIVSGCATLRRGSELDAAFADLDAQLNRASGVDTHQLASIAKRIRARSQTLIDTHETFVTAFNDKASNRSVTAEQLQQLVSDYEVQRQTLRNDLLHLQDELHAALPPDVWSDVLEVLNRKSQSIAARNISET